MYQILPDFEVFFVLLHCFRVIDSYAEALLGVRYDYKVLEIVVSTIGAL